MQDMNQGNASCFTLNQSGSEVRMPDHVTGHLPVWGSWTGLAQKGPQGCTLGCKGYLLVFYLHDHVIH